MKKKIRRSAPQSAKNIKNVFKLIFPGKKKKRHIAYSGKGEHRYIDNQSRRFDNNRNTVDTKDTAIAETISNANAVLSPELLDQQQKKLEDFFLQESREILNLFKYSPVPLIYTDIDGVIFFVNHFFTELTGFQAEELEGKAIAYSLKPDGSANFEAQQHTSFETIINTKDNYRIEVLVKGTWNKIGNRIAGMIFSFQDISGLKREHKTRKVLYQISKITHSELSLADIYRQAHEQLKEIIIATNFYIALWDNKEKRINFPYYTDQAAGDNEIFILRYSTTESIFHYVLKVGKPVLMDFQRYRKMLSYGYIEPWDVMTNTHLWLAVPLKQQQEIIGVLALQSYNNARLYSEKDIDLLEFVAQQLSAAILIKETEKKMSEIREWEKREIEDKEKEIREKEEQVKAQQLKEQQLQEEQLKKEQAKAQQLREQQLKEQQLKIRQFQEQQLKEEQERREKVQQREQEAEVKAAQEKEAKEKETAAQEKLIKEQELKEREFKEIFYRKEYQESPENVLKNQGKTEEHLDKEHAADEVKELKDEAAEYKEPAPEPIPENKTAEHGYQNIEYFKKKDKIVLGSRFRDRKDRRR